MGVDGILSRASTRYTLEDVQERRVDVDSVISLDELENLIRQQVEERTAALQGEVEELRARLTEAEAGGGGLERAAADAALQAEAAALEAKAAAELRAEQAESRVGALEARVQELESGAQGGERVAQLEARVKELEAQLAAAAAPPAKPPARPETGKQPVAARPATGKVPIPVPAKPEAPKPEPKPAPPAAPVSEEDHARAMRTARGLIEDVIAEDEDDARQALLAGSFREKYASALNRAKQSYERRVKEAIRTERDHWEQALKEAEEKAKK